MSRTEYKDCHSRGNKYWEKIGENLPSWTLFFFFFIIMIKICEENDRCFARELRLLWRSVCKFLSARINYNPWHSFPHFSIVPCVSGIGLEWSTSFSPQNVLLSEGLFWSAFMLSGYFVSGSYLDGIYYILLKLLYQIFRNQFQDPRSQISL